MLGKIRRSETCRKQKDCLADSLPNSMAQNPCSELIAAQLAKMFPPLTSLSI
jgi:hypothetical protein